MKIMSKISSFLQFANLAEKMRGIRTEAQDSIQAIETSMQSLADELITVQDNVCLEDASAMIAERLGHILADRRKHLYALQRNAKRLDRHQTTRGVYFSGDKTVSITDQYGSYQPGLPNDATDILALVWGDAEIKKFATEAAAANGAKPKSAGGLTANQAAHRSDEIIAELERLDRERIDAISVLATMPALAIPTHKLAALPQPQPEPEPAPAPTPPEPRSQPSVLVKGADGQMRPYNVNVLDQLY